MNSYQRFKNTLERKPVDRIPIAVRPWDATIKLWKEQGHLKEGDDIYEVFDQDLRYAGWINTVADMDFEEELLEETDTTVLKLDGNGATLRWTKDGEGTPEHVDFSVKTKQDWENKIKPHLLEVDERRIPFEGYRNEKEISKKQQKYFCWHAAGPFELMHPVVGHENMLMAMALDPDWIKDMVKTYVDFLIMHSDRLFEKEGKPDGLYLYEDMGFKFKPFMSPQMYKDIMFEGHKNLFDFIHSKDCHVIVHSCGYVEPLVPMLIEAGMDCLQAMEVKAGMNLPELFKQFGDRIAFFGGFDARALVENNREWIDKEFRERVDPVVKAGGSYILHSDHSEPPQVKFETLKYFVEQGKEYTF